MPNNQPREQSREQRDRFSRLMFSPFPPQQADRQEERDEAESPPLPTIDLMKLFENVSVLTDSLQQLKPLVKKISSLVDFMKK
mgnify:CR=1 FL=1